MDEKIFQLNWGTGGADIKIAAFFTSAKVNRLKKFCKLARRYSSEDERAGLLIALAHEDSVRKVLLDRLGDLARKKADLENNFYGTNFEPVQGWAEKRLLREREQLKKVIEVLTAERWDI